MAPSRHVDPDSGQDPVQYAVSVSNYLDVSDMKITLTGFCRKLEIIVNVNLD